ncbi:E3 ubiquitin-protein ligase TRIM38-like [Suncus etruscus]|uniref:E3 ubiquitin-protein ligase TRIM38-like n=1 Tax=Suncus etruscus TaxID=109475 RepID=UPI0021100A50|nr:E3 ubiquitin-protein ligase TRIM38-like [Suncus etruscus]
MALGKAIQTLREDITCSICLELMTNPVSIDCGHSYCRSCIMRYFKKQALWSTCTWKTNCPVCRAEFQQDSIRPIKQLGNLINTVKKMEQECLCEEHGEQLHLFCEDEEQLICWRCERTPQHKGHVTVLVEDACKVYKDKFQEVLIELRKLEDKNKQWQMNTEEKKQMCQTEIIHKRNQIESYFKEFFVILQEEVGSCLWRLMNARMDVLQRLQDSEAKLEKQGQEISSHILELERKCQGSAQDVLQDVRGNWNRFSALKLHEPEDTLLDTHIMQNVSVRCFKLKEFFDAYGVTITLDSDTAHNDLRIARNKQKVAWGSQQKKPDTPVRFRDLPCILGCQIFTSGNQFFQVSQLKGPEWDVGVCLENVPRDNDIREPASGFWAIRCCKESRYEALTSPPTPLQLEKNIESMKVFLDYENGCVSFYDTSTHSHIFAFQNASFSGPLRAYFRIGKYSSLSLN